MGAVVSTAYNEVACDFLNGQSGEVSLEGIHEEPSSEILGADGMTYPVGFLRVTTNAENGSAVGGLLVADNTGIPLEFMITAAVRPTPAQRVLYGKRLKSYVAVELCGQQLLRQVKIKPKLVFVEEREMLRLANVTDVPVLRLLPSEQLGTARPLPTVEFPTDHTEYERMIDLRSLDQDMVDCFNRVEQCREILAKTREEYRL